MNSSRPIRNGGPQPLCHTFHTWKMFVYLSKLRTRSSTVSGLGGYLGRVRAAVRWPRYTVPRTRARSSHAATRARLAWDFGGLIDRFWARSVAATIWEAIPKLISFSEFSREANLLTSKKQVNNTKLIYKQLNFLTYYSLHVYLRVFITATSPLLLLIYKPTT